VILHKDVRNQRSQFYSIKFSHERTRNFTVKCGSLRYLSIYSLLYVCCFCSILSGDYKDPNESSCKLLDKVWFVPVNIGI